MHTTTDNMATLDRATFKPDFCSTMGIVISRSQKLQRFCVSTSSSEYFFQSDHLVVVA